MNRRPKITPRFPRPLTLRACPAGATPEQDARMQTLAALERRGCVPTGPDEKICHRPRHAAGAHTHMGFLGSTHTGAAGRNDARAVAPTFLTCAGWRLLDACALLFLYVAFCVLWAEERAVRVASRRREWGR